MQIDGILYKAFSQPTYSWMSDMVSPKRDAKAQMYAGRGGELDHLPCQCGPNTLSLLLGLGVFSFYKYSRDSGF